TSFCCPPRWCKMVGEKVGKKRTLPTLQKILFIFLAFGLLNGCGFHLRGSSGFDFSFVHIKSDLPIR
ncbi:hypothetical protein QUF54_10705, partial [Candidatus Marithioploca araucensis]|nr:hypothetical protein [Candidatus Marithioploca araucensis]